MTGTTPVSKYKGVRNIAFFDKLGETISSKSKEVAQKAQDLTDVTKLNAQAVSYTHLIEETYDGGVLPLF